MVDCELIYRENWIDNDFCYTRGRAFEASDSWRSDGCIRSPRAKEESLSFSPPLRREKRSLVLALGVPGQPALGFGDSQLGFFLSQVANSAKGEAVEGGG